MSRIPDSGHVDRAEVFLRLQRELSARLSQASLIEHRPSAGATSEYHWIDFLNRHLPSRFRAAQAFLYDAHGNRSRQIDIAIYDHLRTPVLFPGTSAIHLPVEAVHVILEVKAVFSRKWMLDAVEKAASARALKSRSRHALRAGLVAKSAVWKTGAFASNLTNVLHSVRGVDFGCSVDHGAFHLDGKLRLSSADTALQFFLDTLLALLDPSSKLAHYYEKPR